MLETWGNFLKLMVTSAVLTLTLAFAAVVAIDPYGRLGIKKTHQTAFVTERLIKVTRALDAEFDSAIVGNSTSLLLMPEHLDRLIGHKFVSLSIYGTGPEAILAVSRFFIDNHPNARSVVVGLEDSWCRAPGQTGEWRPFPFWLYSTVPRYLLGLAGETSTKLLLSLRDPKERLPEDGFQSYESGFIANGLGDSETVRKNLTRPRPTNLDNQSLEFPATRKLAEFANNVTRQVAIVLIWTPRYINLIPEPASPAAKADNACKASLADSVAGNPNIKVIDASGDSRPENANPANFFDFIHYRRSLADLIEREIAAALASPMTQSNAL